MLHINDGQTFIIDAATGRRHQTQSAIGLFNLEINSTAPGRARLDAIAQKTEQITRLEAEIAARVAREQRQQGREGGGGGAAAAAAAVNNAEGQRRSSRRRGD
jgi:hypothetical protein